LPERGARQSLQPERRLLVQVKVSEREKAHMVSLARAQGFESIVHLHNKNGHQM